MKKVLLIAGTGTLGASAYPELVKLGYHVDVISLEDYASVTPRLDFIKARADLAKPGDSAATPRRSRAVTKSPSTKWENPSK